VYFWLADMAARHQQISPRAATSGADSRVHFEARPQSITRSHEKGLGWLHGILATIPSCLSSLDETETATWILTFDLKLLGLSIEHDVPKSSMDTKNAASVIGAQSRQTRESFPYTFRCHATRSPKSSMHTGTIVSVCAVQYWEKRESFQFILFDRMQ
jgi:hypothetical protein